MTRTCLREKRPKSDVSDPKDILRASKPADTAQPGISPPEVHIKGPEGRQASSWSQRALAQGAGPGEIIPRPPNPPYRSTVSSLTRPPRGKERVRSFPCCSPPCILRSTVSSMTTNDREEETHREASCQKARPRRREESEAEQNTRAALAHAPHSGSGTCKGQVIAALRGDSSQGTSEGYDSPNHGKKPKFLDEDDVPPRPSRIVTLKLKKGSQASKGSLEPAIEVAKRGAKAGTIHEC